MVNLKITLQCPVNDCNHTVQLLPNEQVPGLYQNTCGGCDTRHEAVVLSPDELAWHDLQVANAVKPEETKAAKK